MKLFLRKTIGLLVMSFLLISAARSVYAAYPTKERNILNPLSVLKLEGDPEAENKKPSPLVKIGENKNFIFYEGEITVSGEYTKHTYGPLGPELVDIVCFDADEETGYLIPREEGDERNPWFCFQNTKEAEMLLGIQDIVLEPENFETVKSCTIRGKTTVTVSNYIVYKGEGGDFDRAKIEGVSTAAPLETPEAKCEYH